MTIEAIAPALLAWFDQHGRGDLPWKRSRDPYPIWISEIMLQQTQVATVIPYFERFMEAFPTVGDLAAASLDDVLSHWTGLGYYARARNLHAAARTIMSEHAGAFPRTSEALVTLPGIGRSTAGAIASMAFDERAPILDGNVKRVLARLVAVDRWPGERETEKALWSLADALTPTERVADYTQAIMDLGATLCVRARPECPRCPLEDRCAARAAGTERALPVPRPKREKPERSTRMLMLQDPEGRILLERRPPSGIWGGLWCFPQLEVADADAPGHLAQRLALPADGIEQIDEWAEVKHVFTHFALRIRPVRLQIRLRPDHVREGNVREGSFRGDSVREDSVREEDLDWFDPARATDLGLAAPVKRLLGVLVARDLLA